MLYYIIIESNILVVAVMKQYLSIILLVVVVSCIGGVLWVYWHKYRPAEIEALCREEAKVNAQKPRPSDDPFKRRERTYQQCLQENGINK